MTMQLFQSRSSRQVGDSKDGAEELISDNMNLVEILVRQLAKTLPPQTDLEDLRQAGFIGLIEAARNFDPDRGLQFDTFASRRVRGAMVDELRSRLWAPRSMSRRLRSIAAITRRLEQEAGRSVTLTEVADALNTTVRDLDRTRSDAARARVQSLNVSECDDRKSSKMLGSASSPAENLETTDFRAALADAIGTLPPREKSVIALRYSKGATQAEVSEQFDLTTSRISQIELGAMANLRSKLGIHSHGVPNCDSKVRRTVSKQIRLEHLPQFPPRNQRPGVMSPTGFPPTSGMRYLLETLSKGEISTDFAKKSPRIKRGDHKHPNRLEVARKMSGPMVFPVSPIAPGPNWITLPLC